MQELARFERIRQFFMARKNEWATIDEIAASGIPKATVTQIIHLTKPTRFERYYDSRYRGDRQKFRLKRHYAMRTISD